MSIGVVAIALGVLWGARNQVHDIIGLENSATKPRIWWYVDDNQPNSHEWLDWGNTGTTEPTEPYLKICQARAVTLWSRDFEVVPVMGRRAALRRLHDAGVAIPEGADRCFPALWMAWSRAAFLSGLGGLWLDGSVLPLADGRLVAERLRGKTALTFGTDPDESLGTVDQMLPAGGNAAGWAAAPSHPVWAGLARDTGALIGAGAQSWSAVEGRRALRQLWDKHCSGTVSVDRKSEVSRDRYGRRLELDTLLGQTDWPTGSFEDGLWVPLPEGRDGLSRAIPWRWFELLSFEEIRDSPFVWARLAQQ